MTIQDNIDTIRGAVKGKDVREAIAQLGEAIRDIPDVSGSLDDLNTAVTNANNIIATIGTTAQNAADNAATTAATNAVKNVTGQLRAAQADANQTIVDLDNANKQVNKQLIDAQAVIDSNATTLAQVQEQSENIQSIATYNQEQIDKGTVATQDQINSISSSLEEKANLNSVFSMANMGQDIKEAMTGGSVAVVGENTILTDNIVDKQVTGHKTDFLNVIDGFNLFNKNDSDVEDNYFYDLSYNKISNEGYATTGYIQVNENLTYSSNINHELYTHFFDESKNRIKSEGVKIFTIPSGCKYIRCTIQKAYKTVDQYMIVKSDTVYTGEYIAYKKPLLKAVDEIKITKNNIENFIVNSNEAEFINKEDNINLFDKNDNDFMDNTYIDESGNWITNNSFATTGYIEVIEGETYCKNNTNETYIALYDSDKNFIESKNDKKITVPTGCKFLRFTIDKAFNSVDTFMVILGEFYLGDYVGYGYKYYLSNVEVKSSNVSGNYSKLKNKKWRHMGDSISSTDYASPTWFEIIKKDTGCDITSQGISGTTLAHTDDRHLWDYHFGTLDATEIGYDKDDSTTWSTGNCFCERYIKLEDDADIVTVMGGTNDNLVPLGDWDSTDTSTFYGALNVLIQGLIGKYPDKIIAFFTPIQTSSCYSANVANASSELDKRVATSALRIQLRAEAIKRKCNQYGIPCLDLFNASEFNGVGDRASKLYLDGTHPTLTGQEILATRIRNFIESLI